MIQKVEHLKKGDLVVIDGNQISVFDSYKKDKFDIITVILYYPIVSNYIWRRNCRSTRNQVVFKITEDNLTPQELNAYKSNLLRLNQNNE